MAIDQKEALKILSNPAKYIDELKEGHAKELSDLRNKIEAEVRALVEEEYKKKADTHVQDATITPPPQVQTQQAAKEDTADETESFFFQEKASDPNFVTNDEIEMFHTELVEKQRMKKGFTLTMVRGPHGSGKTLSCQHYAFKNNLPFLRVDCSTIRDPEKWFGERILKDGATSFKPSVFVRFLEKGNCAIVLDEVNRVQEIGILNPLLPLFDFSGKVHVAPLGRDVKIAKNVAIFMTLNEGSSYTGVTDMIDTALSNRVNYTQMFDYPDPEQEKKIVKQEVPGVDDKMLDILIEVAGSVRTSAKNAKFAVRKPTWTIRNTINAARGLVYTNNNPKSLRYTIINFFKNTEGSNEDLKVVSGALLGKVGESLK